MCAFHGARLIDHTMEQKPLIIVEEHHEVFIAWHQALERGLFQAGQRNTLLHVDAHADMSILPSRRPIPDTPCDMQTIRDFVRDELCISSFILPAVYQKLFDEICWLVPQQVIRKFQGKPAHEKQYKYVRSFQEQKRTLVVYDDPLLGWSDKPWQDRRPFCYWYQSVDYPFDSPAPVILDIDLDYFCCASVVDRFQRLEITAAEYERCRTEPYRKLNLHFHYRLEEADGQYFICFNPPFDMGEAVRNQYSEDAIQRDIEAFLTYLDTYRINPRLITLCRSRHSGYTPEVAWQSLEERLLAGLSKRFDLNISYGT